jgi:hypothetical protein
MFFEFTRKSVPSLLTAALALLLTIFDPGSPFNVDQMAAELGDDGSVIAAVSRSSAIVKAEAETSVVSIESITPASHGPSPPGIPTGVQMSGSIH